MIIGNIDVNYTSNDTIPDYRPLPECLTVGKSDLHGLGIIAVDHIPEEVVLGITHVYDTDPTFMCNLIRTPLGGFLNHSDNANCSMYLYGRFYYLKADRDIKPGEELTVNYKKSECGKSYSFIK